MKIALIRQKFTPFGGAERYMARLVDGLLAGGHEVHVFAAKWEDVAGSGLIFHKVPVIRLAGWLKALSFSRNCCKLVQKEQFDLVFSLERTLCQDIYRAGDGCHRQWLTQKNLDKGLWARAATFANPLHLVYLMLEKRLFAAPRLKAVIANSRRGKDEIVRHYRVPPENIHVVYNGIDHHDFDVARRDACRRSLADEYALGPELRILYVGSGFERKGVPALIRAASRISIPFRLFIVGKGDARKYRAAASRLGISDRVVFTGPVKDVARYYLGCDLFAFPTLYDPFSNATIEAMASGLPVVTTPYNGVAEFVTDGENGYVVADPHADDLLAAAILKMAPEQVRSRMGEAACRSVVSLTMERNIRQTLEIMVAVAAGGRP